MSDREPSASKDKMCDTEGTKHQAEHLESQGTGLIKGINAFEPYIYMIHEGYRNERLLDWSTIVLTNTLQASAISLFRLLPDLENSSQVLDTRSLASLIRNIIDTHDVLRFVRENDSQERFNLHRDILGFYIASRIRAIQEAVDPENAEDVYVSICDRYWERVRNSPLYNKRMKTLKGGNRLFYESRRERVEAVCGQHSDFVMGVIADLSTYVHSVPPPIWLSDINTMYSNNERNRNTLAVWLRVANFFVARSYTMILSMTGYDTSVDLSEYCEHYEDAFD